MSITAARARDLVFYDPIAGTFTWKVSIGTRMAGTPAGTTRSDGYVFIKMDGKRYSAQRLAWLIVTGAWPTHTVDHEDTNPSNNAWSNLREATGKQNSANRNVQSNNRLGVKGVRERNGRFLASISIGGKAKHLGCFGKVEDAIAAYNAAAAAAFGEFARAAV